MHKLSAGLLILTAGWGLGWYTHTRWSADPVPYVQPVVSTPSKPVSVDESTADIPPATPAHVDDIASLLQRHEFDVVMERYESLQVQAGDGVLGEARTQILAHASRLIAERRFGLAEQLLQRFLDSAYRDVEARILLAEAQYGQDDVHAAIDQFYEARGYAYRPAMLKKITRRIRSIVADLTQALTRNNDHNALLALYQHLTQLEPDHAPWFIRLAATQLALDDNDAARRSLLLVSQDPDVGAQAQAMLSELSLATAGLEDAESQNAAADPVGIPLHRRGNHFIVDAKPARGQSIRLLIDTGASLTIFTPEVLEQRGIRYRNTGRSGVFNTANGPVRAPIYTLDALSVGDWQVSNLEIGVLDLSGGSGIDGLLGMNFLSHFQFFIDQNEDLLRLSIN